MRKQIRVGMHWAGPRMLVRHLILAISHLLHGCRPVPAARHAREAPQGVGGQDWSKPLG